MLYKISKEICADFVCTINIKIRERPVKRRKVTPVEHFYVERLLYYIKKWPGEKEWSWYNSLNLMVTYNYYYHVLIDRPSRSILKMYALFKKFQGVLNERIWFLLGHG